MAPTASAPIAAGATGINGDHSVTASAAAQAHVHPEPVQQPLRFDTLAVHKGSEPEPHTGAIIPSISLATAYQQDSVNIQGKDNYQYSRFTNPNRAALEGNLAALEGAKYAFAFSSGTAVTASLLQLVPTNGHVVSVNDVYGGTGKIFDQIVNESNGIQTTYVDLDEQGLKDRLQAAIRPETKLLWIETPTNPTLRVVNVKLAAKFAKEANSNIVVVVDSTFNSPWYLNPLSLGADVVMHSQTKYINGHSDVLMGAAICNDDAIAKRLKTIQASLGAVPSPFDCWLVIRSLKTLPVRMREHGRNALRLAKYLEAHPLIKEVIYPGLPSHPSFALTKSQIAPRALESQVAEGVDLEQGIHYSGMLSFRLDCDEADSEPAEKLLKELKVITLALSLGGVESLIELPSKMTHWMIPLEQRLSLGIGHDLIRLSVGLEDIRDLEQDLDQALSRALGGAHHLNGDGNQLKRRKLA